MSPAIGEAPFFVVRLAGVYARAESPTPTGDSSPVARMPIART